MTNIKATLVDGRGHLLGRLASIVAKQLLNGLRVTVVRCEEMEISGSLFRNKLKFQAFLRKRTNTNPKKGPIHYKSPARMFWRTVRGMIPHKTKRGAAALERLRAFEGIPHPYDKQKRMVVPGALRNLRLKPGRKFCKLGDLADQVGWHHKELLQRLEVNRKVRSAAFYQKKKELAKLRAQAAKNVAGQVKPIEEKLAGYGF
eukprot:CAMPEP_0183360320 /NCGR_PEP_ID=MMETSP0164_2-20130417/54887_1 /TAXON_ID=221442 /ORGANISM="Coccolithus pelagicus ssp braarudi, Strain PLY182g" /LENGTH=201 /DNA_ID=CAMNT_0025534653 /DNA_START=29 /DNA_END=634 /DNA_ORIENTATION=+